jgi:hypothetical protein
VEPGSDNYNGRTAELPGLPGSTRSINGFLSPVRVEAFVLEIIYNKELPSPGKEVPLVPRGDPGNPENPGDSAVRQLLL